MPRQPHASVIPWILGRNKEDRKREIGQENKASVKLGGEKRRVSPGSGGIGGVAQS